MGVEGVGLDEAVADHERVGSHELILAVTLGAEGEVDDLASRPLAWSPGAVTS